MKTITFMRHSYAEKTYGKIDFDRVLRKEGFSKIDTQVSLFKEKQSNIDLCISSSAARTQQTANLFLGEIDCKVPIVLEDWLYEDYTTQDFIDYIRDLPSKYNDILVVAHEPMISTIANRLALESVYGFKPCSILKLLFNKEDWARIELRTGKAEFYLI